MRSQKLLALLAGVVLATNLGVAAQAAMNAGAMQMIR